MGDQPPSPKTDPRDQEFRKKSQWFSFTSQAWGALGMASFIGAISTLAAGLIGQALKMGAEATTKVAQGANLAEAAGVLTNGWAWGVIGGLAALGLGATYMSQRDATELRMIQDEHLAQQNAKCAAPGLVRSQAQTAEYPGNCRADGQEWGPIVKNETQQIRQH